MIKVYEAEKKAGLSEQIQKCVSSVSAAFQVLGNDDDTSKFAALVQDLRLAEASKDQSKEMIDQPDLAYIRSILVSTGWNLNDDVFLPSETAKAKDTPVHKPINLEHDEERIIGHMVESRALNKDGTEIDEKNIPEEFDLEVAGVLYKALLPEVIDDVIEGAKDGKMYVSMECWFDNFDYAVKNTETGKEKVIARTEDTAFLTKHLRRYGGKGVYQGNQIGRLLRDIRFAGKGIVSNPANPESVIKEVAKTAASQSEIEKPMEGGANEMAKENENTLEQVQAELTVKVAEIGSLNEAKAEAEKKLADMQTNFDAQAKVLEDTKATVAKLEETIKGFEATKTEADSKIADLTKRAEAAEAKLADIEKAAKAQARLEQIKALRSVADETATLAELKEMTEETFQTVLKYAGEAKAAATETKTETTDAETEKAKASEALENVATTEEVIQPGDEKQKDEGVETAKALASFLLPGSKKA